MKERNRTLVNVTEAARILGFGITYIHAIKRAMGITCRYFSLTDVETFIRKHPNFQISDVYHRPKPAQTPTISKLQPEDLGADAKNAHLGASSPPCSNGSTTASSALSKNAELKSRTAATTLAGCRTLSEAMIRMRGTRTQSEIAHSCQVGLRTIAGIEGGESVALKSLRRIAKGCQVEVQEWVFLLVAWIRHQIGEEDSVKLDIRNVNNVGQPIILSLAEAKFLAQYRFLSDKEQQALGSALQRREIRSCMCLIQSCLEGRQPSAGL
jgi:hypothetical protein